MTLPDSKLLGIQCKTDLLTCVARTAFLTTPKFNYWIDPLRKKPDSTHEDQIKLSNPLTFVIPENLSTIITQIIIKGQYNIGDMRIMGGKCVVEGCKHSHKPYYWHALRTFHISPISSIIWSSN